MAAAVRGIPWVQDVTVTRQLPDTIVISVQERRVRALVSLDRLYYVDDQGVPFKAVEPEERPNLPVITGFSRADLTERRDRNRRDLDELFALLEVLAERNDQFRLENASELNDDPVRGMTLFTREERIQVKVGLGDYRAKFKRLGRVMAHLKIGGQADGVSYVNLESSPRVVVRKAAADEGRGA
jgi:cell division protein FtsQ